MLCHAKTVQQTYLIDPRIPPLAAQLQPAQLGVTIEYGIHEQEKRECECENTTKARANHVQSLIHTLVITNMSSAAMLLQ
jgi:hypothetical protein